jgi:hypothetical protein
MNARRPRRPVGVPGAGERGMSWHSETLVGDKGAELPEQANDRQLKLSARAKMERAKGIEPSYEAWEASVLPLNYARQGVLTQWQERRDSNPQPPVLETGALTN